MIGIMTKDQWEKIVEALHSACWEARGFGHDDYGLDPEDGVDLYGNPISDPEEAWEDGREWYHPPAVSAAGRVAEILGLEVPG